MNYNEFKENIIKIEQANKIGIDLCLLAATKETYEGEKYFKFFLCEDKAREELMPRYEESNIYLITETKREVDKKNYIEEKKITFIYGEDYDVLDEDTLDPEKEKLYNNLSNEEFEEKYYCKLFDDMKLRVEKIKENLEVIDKMRIF